MNRYRFVADHQRRHGVKRLCTILGIVRSSFSYWRKTAADRAARQAADAKLAVKIRVVHRESDGTYGVPRITAELRDGGEHVNHRRIARVIRTIGLADVRLRRRRRTQSAAHGPGPVSCPALQVADAVEEFGAALAREGGDARVVGAGVAQSGEGDLRQLVFVHTAQPHRLVVVPTSDNVTGAVMLSRPAAWSSPTPTITRAVVSWPRRPGSAGRPCTGELGQR
ncbi:IS3 family transposase [Streptomyces mirabilis]|uniref:IS3 family transposase n=1 Tax=Streptomyces mirabilis TaxID=68239 RepID=UPI003330998E